METLAWCRWSSVPHMISDVAILVLPLPLIWRLHTTLEQKVGLTAIFLLGGL